MNFFLVLACALFSTFIDNNVAAKLGQLDGLAVNSNHGDVNLNLRVYDVTPHSISVSWSPPINLDPIGYTISFDGIKEYVDSQGIPETVIFDKIEVVIDSDVEFYIINQLTPFTTYNVNVSAVTADHSHHSPSKITIVTQKAAPKPMLKPDFYGVVDHEEIQVTLPSASGEYGPINHYYLIVVPEDQETADYNPDQFSTDTIINNQKKISDHSTAPYIAAKFPNGRIPYTFNLGSGEECNGFNNRKLEQGKKYRMFVRAVVTAPQQELYTSSPFSDYLSLDMPRVPDLDAFLYNDTAVSSHEGTPIGPPTNISYHFQTPDVVSIVWDPPTDEDRNGEITKYDIQFHKTSDRNNIIERNVTSTKAVFINLNENTGYVFHIRACTSEGTGPFSEKISIQTERNIERAPTSVRAVATSDSSVEVWWEPVSSRRKLIGYQIFYTTTTVEDLDQWQQKTVGLTESVDLINLKEFFHYTIAVAARFTSGLGRLSEKITVKVKAEDVPINLKVSNVTTHSLTLTWLPPIQLHPINYKIAFDAVKVFVDDQGIKRTQSFDNVEISLEPSVRSHTINNLSPHTAYNINVSAIPGDYSYSPPKKKTVTTQMAAPKPMWKPDFYGVTTP